MMSFLWGGVTFDAAKDIPSLKDKVVLVTGGNSGLGKQSVLDFARHDPAHIFLASRDLAKAQAAVDEIQAKVPSATTTITALELDLSSFTSIRNAAKAFAAQSRRLDILMLNAGVMAAPAGLTTEGYELQFGTNHVGHALLTKLLLPTPQRTAAECPPDVRVVILTSGGIAFAPAKGIHFDVVKTECTHMPAFTRYGHSKLANTLFARELAAHHPELKVTAIHPGPVETNLGRYLMVDSPILRSLLQPILRMLLTNTPDVGVRNQMWAAVAPPDTVVSGEYYIPVGRVGVGYGTGLARDKELARQLWEWTEQELKDETI